jgi:hypothetical protein
MLSFQYFILAETGYYYFSKKISTSPQEICKPFNFSYADEIASKYMKIPKAMVCDSINFVSIDEKIFNNSNEKEYFINIFKNQTNFKNFTTQDYLGLGLIYTIHLNMKDFIKSVNVEEINVKCIAQEFDKKHNVEETTEVQFNSIYFFEKEKNYTLYFDRHGFYYISCYDNRNKLIFGDSFYIFPNNMTKLIEERKQSHIYQINDTKLEFEPTEEIRFLDVENRLKIDKKMNVLMIAIDSMSYAHLRRSMPLTFAYLNKELSNNILYTSVNIVGENTHPNFLAFMAGIVSLDSPNLKGDTWKYKKNDDSFYDKYPFMWYEYEKLGYLTAFQVIFNKSLIFKILIFFWL